jgi:hypothetical protein
MAARSNTLTFTFIGLLVVAVVSFNLSHIHRKMDATLSAGN